MLKLRSFILYVLSFNIQCLVCKSEYSNEWLAEIHANENEVKALAKRNGFQYISKIGDDMFVLKHIYSQRSSRARAENVRKNILKENKVNTLLKIQENGNTDILQVVFVEQQKWNKWVSRSVTFNDQYWSQMWYLNGNVAPDMGLLSSWSKGYTGKGVTIGIVDDGVDKNHPDLQPNFNAELSIDVYDHDKDPSPENEQKHGTECAGIAVAAANNSNCVVGVAYESQLAGLRIAGQELFTSVGLLEALLAPGIDIYSVSWGVPEERTIKGPDQIVKCALLEGVQKGRNGSGSIYVWAAGNGGSDDNCNCDGYVNSIYTIAISSVSSTFQPPRYAEPCAAIMASTFSGEGEVSNNIYTTSLNGRCATTFQGTSAAAPMAAGIFALVLQANPNLTWRDLQHLIVNTSSLVSLKFGKNQVNGAGRTVSDYFGFGLLKSDLLIERAQHWSLVSEQHVCLSTPKEPFQTLKIFPEDPKRNVTSSIYSNRCKKSKDEVRILEHVEVDVHYSYSLRGAIMFFLISPSGTQSQLLTRRKFDSKNNSNQTWTFMSLQFWDENPHGKWTLLMSLNGDYQESGQLNDWSLRLYGTTINANDTDKDNDTTDETNTDNTTTVTDSDQNTDTAFHFAGVDAILILFVCAIHFFK